MRVKSLLAAGAIFAGVVVGSPAEAVDYYQLSGTGLQVDQTISKCGPVICTLPVITQVSMGGFNLDPSQFTNIFGNVYGFDYSLFAGASVKGVLTKISDDLYQGNYFQYNFDEDGCVEVGSACHRQTVSLTFTAVGRNSTPSVPEPATWAMMLIGFGAVGSAMRRKRHQTASVSYC